MKCFAQLFIQNLKKDFNKLVDNHQLVFTEANKQNQNIFCIPLIYNK